MKRIIELSIKGVGIALALFTLFGVITDRLNGGVFEFHNFAYTKMVTGAIIVGLGFSIPGIIYEKTDLSYIVKILVHMGTGCAVFIITGYLVGWFSPEQNIWQCVLIVLGGIIVSFLLLLGFILYDRKMAKKINERIKEMEFEEEKNSDI